MKYIFFGSPRFAAIVLKNLIAAGFPPAALVANPDRPVGRKKVITPPATKALLAEKNIDAKIFQPEKFDEQFIASLKTIAPDFFVVAAYAKIIPQSVLGIPRLGTLGTHPSLLPRYRGASPIQSVILNGERETGATIYMMDAKMDHGAILASEKIAIDPLHVQYPELEETLGNLSGKILAAIIPQLIARTTASTTQDEGAATFTKKFTTDNAYVDADEIAKAETHDAALAKTIIQKINALTPEPGVWTKQNGVRIKLLAAELRDGKLFLTCTQKEGGKPVRH